MCPEKKVTPYPHKACDISPELSPFSIKILLSLAVVWCLFFSPPLPEVRYHFGFKDASCGVRFSPFDVSNGAAFSAVSFLQKTA